MTRQNLSDFFREKRAHARPDDVDWERRRAEWIEALESLYRDITGLLHEPVAAGSLTLDRRMKTLTEDHLGTYEVPELILRVGDEIAVFSPKGRNVVGASGRVDLVGEMGEATLVLQPGPRWAIIAQRVPTLRIIPLDQDSLLAALSGVMRP